MPFVLVTQILGNSGLCTQLQDFLPPHWLLALASCTHFASIKHSITRRQVGFSCCNHFLNSILQRASRSSGHLCSMIPSIEPSSSSSTAMAKLSQCGAKFGRRRLHRSRNDGWLSTECKRHTAELTM